MSSHIHRVFTDGEPLGMEGPDRMVELLTFLPVPLPSDTPRAAMRAPEIQAVGALSFVEASPPRNLNYLRFSRHWPCTVCTKGNATRTECIFEKKDSWVKFRKP